MEGKAYDVARWMRDRRCERTETDDGRLRIDCRPVVAQSIKILLSALLGTDVVLKPKSEWPDRVTWSIAFWWLGGMVVAIAFTFLWGTLYGLISTLSPVAASDATFSLVSLFLGLAIVVVWAIHRYWLDRPHPAVDQHQILEFDGERCRYRYASCDGWLDDLPADFGAVPTSEIEFVELVSLDHPGPGGRNGTPAVELQTAVRTLQFGHGLSESTLSEVADAIRDRSA